VSVTAASSLAVVLAMSAPAQQGPPPSFPSRVESVYVDAFVTHGGEPVLGLAAENFEIHDNGVRQDVRLVSLDLVPVAVLLVFDTSSSVAGETLRHLRTAGHAILDGLRPGDRAALITFNQEVVVRVAPGDDLARVRGALDRLRAYGATALYDAAYVAMALPVPGARPVVVLFSDGEDNQSWLQAEDVQGVAARADILLHAIGVGDRVPVVVRGRRGEMATNPSIQHAASRRAEDLRRIAELTGGRFWEAERTEHLRDTFLRILAEMRTRYLLAYEPTGVDRTGDHRLDVRLKGAEGEVRSRRHYYVAPLR
jgi:VWFA-related protein